MSGVLNTVAHGLTDAFLMAWEVWWALVFGFGISAVVQAWVPRERIQHALAGGGTGTLARATGLGAASSSCSYAAIAIAKSLFQKGASASSALALQFASTNLVWELGIILWILIGWQFAVAEYVGGVIMIALMAVLLRLFVSPRFETQARDHAQEADALHQHHTAGEAMSWRLRLTSASAWSDVAHSFRGDWQMLWKEFTVGFLIAGFVAQLGDSFFNGLFLRLARTRADHLGRVHRTRHRSAELRLLGRQRPARRRALVGGHQLRRRDGLHLRRSDRVTHLEHLPQVLRQDLDVRHDGHRRACHRRPVQRASLIPQGARPTRADIFSPIHIDYKLALNILGIAIFATLFWITARRGITDPACGMRVDRAKAITRKVDGQTFYFCSEHCEHAFLAGLAQADAAQADPAKLVRS